MHTVIEILKEAARLHPKFGSVKAWESLFGSKLQNAMIRQLTHRIKQVDDAIAPLGLALGVRDLSRSADMRAQSAELERDLLLQAAMDAMLAIQEEPGRAQEIAKKFIDDFS
jgi:hypothetical protein